jgi:Holliday junction resolvasome RuvABC endonuclease subunit
VNTLALDLGTKCGWAVFDAQGIRLASGTWTLQSDRQRRFEGAGMKWLRLRGYLSSAVALTGLNLRTHAGPVPLRIVIEEVRRHMGVDAAHAYGGALAVVSAWCEEHGVPYEAFPVGTIKKHATGKGNASKSQMVEAAQKRWPGVELSGDDEADALWIGDLATQDLKRADVGGGG